MSLKTLTIKNNTGAAVLITDRGYQIAASSSDVFTDLDAIRWFLTSGDLLTLCTDSGPTLTLNDGTSDIAKAAVPNFVQWFDTGRSSKMVVVDPNSTMDYDTIEEALGGILDMRGASIGLRGGQTHDVDSVLDVRGVTFHAIGEGRPVIRAQTGGQLEIGGSNFRGIEIEVPSTTGGFSGTFFIDVVEGGNEFVGCDFNPESGKSVFGCDSGISFSTVVMRYCGQSGSGVMVDSGSPFTSPFWICIGENLQGTMEFDAEDVYMDDAARADTTTGILTGIPSGQLFIAAGERLQVGIDSIGSIGGGTVFVLPGTHNITTSLNITDNNVNFVGIGNPIIKNSSGTWAGGTTNNDAMLNIGATDGTSPNNGCTIEGIRFENDVNIHGIQVNGGERNSVIRNELISTTLKTALRVGILFTDGASAEGKQFRVEGNFISSTTSAVRWVDGVHVDGNNTLGTYGYGNRVRDSIIFNNIVEYAGETCYVFVDVDDSSIFTNRASDVCFNTGAIGLAMIGCSHSVCTVNSVTGNNVAGATSGLYVSGCSDCTIEHNTIDGGSTVFPIGIRVQSNSDRNIIGGNTISNSTTGLSIAADSNDNAVRPNSFGSGVTTQYADLATDTRYVGSMIQGTGSPNGSVTGQFGDQYLDTNNNLTYLCISYPQGTTWRITAGGWISQQTIYVGKHGNDSNTGFSMQDAKLTFTSAMAAATALTPGSGNEISIWCEDSGQYNESFTIPSYVNVFARNAVFVGVVTISDNAAFEFMTIGSTSQTVIQKTSGSGTAIVRGNGITSRTTGGGINLTSGNLYVEIDIIQAGTGHCLNNTSTGELWVRANEIRADASGSYCLNANSAGGKTHIIANQLDGATGASGIVIATSAIVNAHISDINVPVAYNVGAGTTLNLHVGAISGTETVAATGVANVTYSGTDIPRGTSFPSQPADGRFFYRTDDDHLYRYDSGRAKWLGELDWDGGGRSGTQGSNTYFRRFNGMVMSATLGTLIPYDVTITGITWAKGNANSGTIEVRRNGVLVVGVATAAATNGSDLTLNSDFASGGIFSLYWNSANSTSNVQIKVYYRRLQT